MHALSPRWKTSLNQLNVIQVLESIRKRSKGKNTRFKVLFALTTLGPGYHSGGDIRMAFSKAFPRNHFDFMYLEPLCYSYKIVQMKPKLRKSVFLREARNTLFEVQEGCFESIIEYFKKEVGLKDIQNLSPK